MNFKYFKYILLTLVGLLLIINISVNIKFKNKILPNTYISGIYVGNLTPEEALDRVKILVPTNKNITLATPTKDYVFNSNYFKLEYDLKDTVNQAYMLGRSRNGLQNFSEKLKSLVTNKNIPFSYQFDNSLIDIEISRIVGQEKISGNDAYFVLDNGGLSIKDENTGLTVDNQKLRNILEKELAKSGDSYIKIPFKDRLPEVTSKDLAEIKVEVSSKFYNNFTLNFFDKKRVLAPKEVFTLVKIRKNRDGIYYDLNEEILKKLTFEVRDIVDNKPRARVSKFEGDKVLSFEINQEGSVLDEAKFRKEFRSNLFSGNRNMNLPSIKIGSNFSKESYGITNLLGIGKSTYHHSINSRVHNLALAAKKS